MKANTIKYSLILLGLFFAAFLQSCKEDGTDIEFTGTLEGKVVNGEGVALTEVEIKTTPATNVVLTNENGEFLLEDIKEEEYSIIANKIGFETEVVQAKVNKDEVTRVEIELKEEGWEDKYKDLVKGDTPEDGATEQLITVELKWTSEDTYQGKDLLYDIVLYEFNSPERETVAENLTDTTYTVPGLKANTTYFWYIVIKTEERTLGPSETLSFKTITHMKEFLFFTKILDNQYEIFAADTINTNQNNNNDDDKDKDNNQNNEMNIFQITFDPARDVFPKRNPTHEQIGYVSEVNGDKHIYTMNPDGSNIFRVTTVPLASYHQDGSGFAWSPDGGYIIYCHYDKLYKINRGGYDIEVITTAPEGRHFKSVDWSKFTDKLVVLTSGVNINDTEIYTMDPDGENHKKIVDNLPGRMDSPRFSLDGSKIYYTRDVSELETDDGQMLDNRVFAYDLETEESTDLSANKAEGSNDLMPTESSNGGHLLLTNRRNDGRGTPQIIRLSLDGSNRSEVLDGEMAGF